MDTTSGGAAKKLDRKGTRRAGFWVVLLGPDGVGKTTVIAGLQGRAREGFEGAASFHLRAGLVAQGQPAATNCHPHGQQERSWVVSAGKLLYLLAANWLAYLWVVRPLQQRNRLVLFDRYFPDALVDPKRYRIPQSCTWLAGMVGRWLPEPDLYAVLEAPTDVLLQRKQEMAICELERVCEKYHRLGQQKQNAVLVDASRPCERVVDAVMAEIAMRRAEAVTT